MQDYVKAVEWYQKAALQGKADAQYNLGIMYEQGKGVKQDSVEAIKWWQKAVAQGLAPAQYALGNMYAHGRGIKQNYQKA